MEALWYLASVAVVGIALLRWHRFSMSIVKLANAAEDRFGTLVGVMLKAVAVVTMLFAIVYFFTTTAQYMLKAAMYGSCLTEEGFVTRVTHCVLKDPRPYLGKPRLSQRKAAA